jgi:nitrogen fixation protein FixH
MTSRLAAAARSPRDEVTPPGPGGFRLNGRHVLGMLVVFFSVVFAVNFAMIRVALTTFRGVQGETPYKNGLAYNTRLAEARSQAQRGWTVDARVDRSADGRVRVDVEARDKDGRPIGDLTGIVRLERPTDKRMDREAEIVTTGFGRYKAQMDDVAIGLWDVVVLFGEGGPTEFESRNRLELR